MPVRVGGSWPSITALLSAQGPEDTNYEPEDMNSEEIERAAKLSVRKSAALEYYCANASGLDVAGLGNGTLTSDERIRRKFEEQ